MGTALSTSKFRFIEISTPYKSAVFPLSRSCGVSAKTTPSVTFYLFHGLRKERWAVVKEHNLLREAEKALADGRIRHLGFSFHGEFKVFKDVTDSYNGWTFCRIQN